jgi:segregation and condensation protein B
MAPDRDDLPFQTMVQHEPSSADRIADAGAAKTTDADWSLAALEEAYQRALESADAVAEQVELETAQERHSDTGCSTNSSAATSPSPDVARSTMQIDRISPEQVLEALLFVGGEPLTGRRLADLLGGETISAQVDQLVDQLNARYDEQCRPYHILPGEGGYRLALRPEFEAIRSRVYGLGPRDVRLSQDALEVLALVAYQQPVDRDTLEATGKTNVHPLVRQLLRLELIALERGDGGKDDIRYRTTARFLQLFSLARLEELPHPEDLMFK